MQVVLPIALTCGEPAGVAPEITLKAWLKRRDSSLPTPPFYYLGDANHLESIAKTLFPTEKIPITCLNDPKAALDCFMEAVPVWHIPFAENPQTGKQNPRLATQVCHAIATAVQHIQHGQAGAMVTNPIDKHNLQQAGFAFPGHTEYLGHLCGLPAAQSPVMMLSCAALRVIPVTIHIPLKDVAARLNTNLIEATAHTVLQALQHRYGIKKPRLAIAALNPHAGEKGVLGDEEINIISPAIHALQQQGYAVSGCHAADTLFHAEARKQYDAVLCMYHDQALIPLKTLDFWGGINTTLGLPIIRTSPDHGTGIDIAGRGIARADSLCAALQEASRLANIQLASVTP